MISTAFESTSISAICSASSALPGWLTSSDSMSTPSRLHHDGSSACSTSMNAATPPLRWALATACRARVVLPLDSGPNSSMIRPRGSPLPPSARSSDSAPVEIPSTSRWLPSPSFMIAPAPNAFSIWLIVLFSAFSSADTTAGLLSPDPCRFATACLPPEPWIVNCTQGHYSIAQALWKSSSRAAVSAREAGPCQRGVDGAVGGEGRAERDDFGGAEGPGRPGAVAVQGGRHIRRRSAGPAEPAERDVGLEP